MKKLKQGDLCKIWADNAIYYGIFKSSENGYNYFSARIDKPLSFTGLYHHDPLFAVEPIMFLKSTKVTVWKQSSFDRATIPYRIVARSGEFVNSSVILNELVDGLVKIASVYAAKKFIDKLKEVRL